MGSSGSSARAPARPAIPAKLSSTAAVAMAPSNFVAAALFVVGAWADEGGFLRATRAASPTDQLGADAGVCTGGPAVGPCECHGNPSGWCQNSLTKLCGPPNNATGQCSAGETCCTTAPTPPPTKFVTECDRVYLVNCEYNKVAFPGDGKWCGIDGWYGKIVDKSPNHAVTVRKSPTKDTASCDATKEKAALQWSDTFGVQELRNNGFLFLIKSWTIGYRQSGWGSAGDRDQNTYALKPNTYGSKQQDKVHISYGDEIQLQNPSYWSWVLTAATGSYKSDTYWSPEKYYGKKYTCWKFVKA